VAPANQVKAARERRNAETRKRGNAKMTNDQTRITNEFPMSNAQTMARETPPFGHWVLVIHWSFWFGH
jgi:hypothetical protein